MSQSITNLNKWQAILRQQRQTNIEYWLHQLDTCEDLNAFVIKEYDNLLRTLESALQQDTTFDLAYRLIQKLSFVVFGYVDWDRWLVYLQGAEEMSHRLQREAEQAFIKERICHIYFHRADFEAADKLYRETADIFERLGDIDSYAFTLSRLGLTTYELYQDLSKSIALCNEAIQLAEPLQNDLLKGHLYDALSYIYNRAREWRLGLQAAQKGYAFIQDSNHPRMKEHIQSRIVLAHIFLEEWEAVQEKSAQLTEMFLAAGDIAGLAGLKLNLGVAAFKQGNYVLSESLWQEVLSLQSQIQRPLSLAHVCNNLGKVYTKMGEWEAAHNFLDKAISLFEQLADTYEWVNSMDNLVDLYEAQGDKKMCRDMLTQVLTQLKDAEPDTPVQKLLAIMRQRLQTLS